MKKGSIYTDFIGIDSILEDFKNSPQMQKAIKRKNLFNMWEKTVGVKFAKKSKPYSLMGYTLVIACQNPSIAQELILRKFEILQKLTPYLKALKMHVKDIKFDSKRWINESTDE